MKIEEEIKQKQFSSQRLKALVNVLFTASWFYSLQNTIFKKYDISWQQFNILRILKGQKGKPCSLKMLSERMIDRNSNTSRLVDKLERKGYVARHSNEIDRRKVDIVITPSGLDLAHLATVETDELVINEINSLTEEEEMKLNELLDKLRG
ncbi:MAG TPA: MarR family transcriptional regulator [Bacteroidales bacterium]|nr:MarR family transcriptional regulator [Bacteroidales bacterium]